MDTCSGLNFVCKTLIRFRQGFIRFATKQSSVRMKFWIKSCPLVIRLWSGKGAFLGKGD